MDFEMPEELRMLRRTLRRFVEERMFPLERDFLQSGHLEEADRKRIQMELKDLGIWALNAPVELGGAGINALGRTVVSEELARCAARVGPGGSPPEPLLHNTTPYQMERFVLPCLRGEMTHSEAFTEPNAGSDIQSIQTSAVQDGDEWVINGEKAFIGGAHRADIILTLTVTDKEKRGRGGMTWFVVEKDRPGFQVTRVAETMGDDWEHCFLSYNNVRLPAANIIGEVGQGFMATNTQLAMGRLNIGATNNGYADRCLGMSVEYSKQRVAFGEPIANRQAIQWMLADSALELYAGRLMVCHVAWLADQGRAIRNEAFYVKLHCANMSWRVADRAVQIFGGAGYGRDLPLQSFLRSARVWRIGHGTDEIHRWMIARNLLKGMEAYAFE